MPRQPPPPQWKPGQSGNPGGRPKRSISFQQLCREEQPANFERLKAIAADTKHKQQVEAIKIMLAYDLGRPIQMQNVRVIRGIEDLTQEELLVLAGLEKGDDAVR
jgi:Family of unknown function (DUF5681)